MMPEVTFDGSKHKDKLDPILPDAWPILQDGPIRCQPWCAAIFDAPDAFVAEMQARDLKRAIERGAKFWNQWEILWRPEELASVLAKAPRME